MADRRGRNILIPAKLEKRLKRVGRHSDDHTLLGLRHPDLPGLEAGIFQRHIRQLDGDTALFRLADPGSPTVIQDREGSPALYVLMPMRV